MTSTFTKTATCYACSMRAKEWCALGDDLSILDDMKSTQIYKPGQTIFHQGTPSLGVYCVEAGTIALRKIDTLGNESLIRLLHEGQTLGYRTFFSQGIYSSSAQALTESRICFVDKDKINALMERNPIIATAFLRHLAEDLQLAEEDKMNLTNLPVRTRLAKLLLSLKDYYGDIDEQGNLNIKLPLSRQDMASMIGARPETLSRTIRALEKDDVALFMKHIVQISDLDSLLDEVENEI